MTASTPVDPPAGPSAADDPVHVAPADTDPAEVDPSADPVTSDPNATRRLPLPRSDERSGRGARSLQGPVPGLREPLGWLLVAALTLVVGLTWLPLDAPFGNDHDGRNNVLNAMQVEQVEALGLTETDLGSSLGPYWDRPGYAHHPPAMKLPYLAAAALPVPLSAAIRGVSYGLGLMILPGLAYLLRRRGVAWAGVLAGVGVVAATPLFWAYGRLHGPIGATVVLAALVADLRDRDELDTSRWRLAAAAVLAAFVAASSWYGLAAAALLGLWLLAGRRRVDDTVVMVGLAMVLAAVATLWWVVGLSGTEDMGSSVAGRITDTGYSLQEWTTRITRWFDELVPTWTRVLGAVALVGAVVDRRVRVPFAAALVLAVGWIGAVPGGSFVHDYWIFPVVLPLGIGLAGAVGVLTEQVARLTGSAATALRHTSATRTAARGDVLDLGAIPAPRPHQPDGSVDGRGEFVRDTSRTRTTANRTRTPARARAAADRRVPLLADLGIALVATVLAVTGVNGLSTGEFGAEYETEPRDMGEALALARPLPVDAGGQAFAWHTPTVPGLLTVAWEWERPARALTEAAFAEASAGDHVLVRCSRPPRYLPSGADVCAAAIELDVSIEVAPRGTDEPVLSRVAQVGDYAVTTVGQLRDLQGATP